MSLPIWPFGMILQLFQEGGATALQYACIYEDYESIKLLLDNNANPNKRGLCYTYPLSLSISGEYSVEKKQIIELLLSKGAEVGNSNPMTFWGVPGYSHDLLLAATLHPDSKAFHKAIQKDITELFAQLIQQSKNKSPKDSGTGNNALIIAAKVGNIELVDYLLENDYEDINYQNDLGQTALFLDEQDYNNNIPDKTVTMLKHLVKKGIDTSIKDNYGMTAYDYADMNDCYEIAKILKPRAASTNSTEKTTTQSSQSAQLIIEDIGEFFKRRTICAMSLCALLIMVAILIIRKKVIGLPLKQQKRLITFIVIVFCIFIFSNAIWWNLIKMTESGKEKINWDNPYVSFTYKGSKYMNFTNTLLETKLVSGNDTRCDGYYELVTSTLTETDDRKAENQERIDNYCRQHVAFDLIENHSKISNVLGTFFDDKMYEADSGCGIKIYHNNEEDVYCKKSDLDKVKKYYSDINNYHWYLTYGISDPRIRIDDYDNAIINQAYLVNRQTKSDRDYETKQSITLISNDNILQIEVNFMVFKNGTGYLSLDNGDEVDLNIDFRKYDPYITEY